MEQVALQEYCRQIEGLIERSAYDEAAAHCKHILQQHPKYIEAYRLLGKVALDREDDKQATELFARVLSADPADFVSRAGLSIVYDRQGAVKDAAWQMERAYELAPGNPVVQEELGKLYARRDGAEPSKVPLTRGALARLYFNGELYGEAIGELRAILAQQPDRVDLQALLAEALWRDDQRMEAADTALKVLDRLPYCLDANLILGEIWMNSGREEDADVHLKRAQALDPLAMRANMLFGKSSPVPAKPIEVSKLEYTPPIPAPTAEDQIPDWLTGVGAQAEPGVAASEEVPAWLQGIGLPSPQPEPPPAKEAPTGLTATPSLAATPIDEEIPDWLAGIGAAAPPPEALIPEAPAQEVAPDWLSRLGGATPPTEQPAEEAAPDWLAQLRAEAGPIPGAEVEAVPEAETPEWLQALQPQAPEPPAPSEGAEESVPDWLAQLPAGATPIEAPLEEAATGAPDWLPQMQAGVIPQAPPETPSAAPEPGEIPDWLQALRPEGAEQPAQVAGMPDWLSGLETEVAPTPGMEAEAALEEPLAAPEPGEIPDWLKALEPAAPAQAAPPPPPPASVEETLAWMTGEGAMPSPEEAMAYFQKLTAGKETELQAQAQAEGEARMADIMGRKPAQVEPVAPPPITPAPTEELGIQAPVEAEIPEWLAGPAPFAPTAPAQELGAEAPVEAEIPEWLAAVAPAPVEAEEPFWLTALKQAEAAVAAPPPEVMPVEIVAPVTPQAAGPEWWYQTLEDEQGPVPMLTIEEPPAAEVAPSFAPPPPPPAPKPVEVAPVVAPPPIPKVVEVAAPPAPKKLVRAKPRPAGAQPTVDMDALLARLRANPADHEALLGMARGWVQQGDLNAARGAYDELIRVGALLDEVIADLEKFTEDHPDDVEFIRLMGDAHMKAGNLQKALKLYRQALKKL
jgi:tetratricopeptide (TPR) repeat protein